MKSNPMAVSEERRERCVMTVTPPIMSIAPIAAPIIPGKPNRNARAIPGRTPWASASPIKAIPRMMTNVPAMAHAMETRMPAMSACIMKGFEVKGVIIPFIRRPILTHPL